MRSGDTLSLSSGLGSLLLSQFAGSFLSLAGLLGLGLDLLRGGELKLGTGEAPVPGAAAGVGGAWRSELRGALVVGLGGWTTVLHLLIQASCVLQALGLAAEQLQVPFCPRGVELEGGGAEAQALEVWGGREMTCYGSLACVHSPAQCLSEHPNQTVSQVSAHSPWHQTIEFILLAPESLSNAV